MKRINIRFSLVVALLAAAFMSVQATDNNNYLHFVSLKGGDTVRLNKYEFGSCNLTAQFEYSTDNRLNWNDYSWNGETGTSIALTNAGDTVWFRAGQGGIAGTNANLSTGMSCFYKFVFGTNDSIAAGGNIMSLYNGSCQQTTMTEYGFYGLFEGCKALTTAPLLPATGLADFCYVLMFNGCTALTSAPVLPATNLGDGCYREMFKNCTSLTTAPSLPATVLAKSCYSNMFKNCTSLTTAPSLSAEQLETSCCTHMFEGCSSLKTAPALPATQMATACYYYMFYNCTSLTTAPTLQATKLKTECYLGMFSGCTSLKVDTCDGSCAGALLTTPSQGADDWNRNMFQGCQGSYANNIKLGSSYCITGAAFNVNVNVNDTTMGSVAGAGIYACGDTVKLTATAKAGYKFVNWSTGETTATISFEMENHDTTLTATFALISGVEEIEVEKYVAYAEDGSIIVNGVTGCSVAIYDMNGRLVGKIEKANETERFAVGISGVYVVTVDNKAEAKVIVK